MNKNQLAIEIPVSNEILLEIARKEYEKDKLSAIWQPVHLIANIRDLKNITYHVTRVISRKEVESWKKYKILEPQNENMNEAETPAQLFN